MSAGAASTWIGLGGAGGGVEGSGELGSVWMEGAQEEVSGVGVEVEAEVEAAGGLLFDFTAGGVESEKKKTVLEPLG